MAHVRRPAVCPIRGPKRGGGRVALAPFKPLAETRPPRARRNSAEGAGGAGVGSEEGVGGGEGGIG